MKATILNKCLMVTSVIFEVCLVCIFILPNICLNDFEEINWCKSKGEYLSK